MFISIFRAIAHGWSLRVAGRLVVVGRVKVDILNLQPLQPIPKGTPPFGRAYLDYTTFR